MLQMLTTSPRFASFVAAATSALGVTSLLDWIPDDVGKFATLLGTVLTAVLIFNHLRNGSLDRALKRAELERHRREAESYAESQEDS